MPESPVREVRLALTVERHEEAVAFYRDRLGLPVLESFDGLQLTLFTVLDDAGPRSCRQPDRPGTGTAADRRAVPARRPLRPDPGR